MEGEGAQKGEEGGNERRNRGRGEVRRNTTL